MKQIGTWWAKAAEITDEGPKVFSVVQARAGAPSRWPARNLRANASPATAR